MGSRSARFKAVSGGTIVGPACGLLAVGPRP